MPWTDVARDPRVRLPSEPRHTPLISAEMLLSISQGPWGTSDGKPTPHHLA